MPATSGRLVSDGKWISAGRALNHLKVQILPTITIAINNNRLIDGNGVQASLVSCIRVFCFGQAQRVRVEQFRFVFERCGHSQSGGL